MGKILKTLIFDGQVSLAILDTTDIVNKAIKYHGLTALTSAALGRTMTASIFMASTMKNKSDRLSVTIKGDGVGGNIIVSCDSKLNVRGCIDNPKATLPLNEFNKLDVKGCVGNGKITVVKNTGIKGNYVGTSQIVSGEIAEDFAYYYTVSEQQPTAMALGVLVNGKGKCIGAGGVIMQKMPGCDDEAISKAEEIIKNYSNISTIISEIGADGLAKRDFNEYEFSETPCKYKCICSKKYINNVVRTLGVDEANDILKEQGAISIECLYCNKKYTYLTKDIDEIFNK